MTTRRLALLCSCLALAVLPAAAAAAPVLQGPPPRAITAPASIVSPRLAGAGAIPVADLFKTVTSYSAVWAPDGASLIVSADLKGRLNLWRQPLAGGAPTPLTQSEDRQWFQLATPDGKWVIYQSDKGGREIYDLYAVPAGGGEAVDLTASDGVSETSPIVSADSGMVAFSARGATEAQTNVGVIDLATRKMRMLSHEAEPSMMWTPVAFSRDGRYLIANRGDVNRAHSAAYRIDLASGAAERLTADEAHAYATASDLSPDGRSVALTTETAAGDHQAAVLDLASHKITLLKPDAWEQTSGKFSPDGRTLLAVSNVDGRDTVLAYDLAARKAEVVPLPAGVNSDFFGNMPAFSPDGARILFPHESGSAPLDYWILDRASGRSAQATHMAALDASSLPKTQVVHYKSADGTVVSAVLWMPYNLARDGRAPAVIYPHGGPTGQTKDMFDRTPAALASRGYLVLAPNPRGSTGYGRAFQDGNVKDLGGGDLEDEVAGVKFLVATGYVDARKVGITGGSYGGFMTLMAVGKTPDIWAAAVDEFGIVNWRSMWERGSPQLREYQRGLLGDPATDPAVYDAASPLTFLGHAKAPLLVLQGENDIRVPKGESEQIVDFLTKKGGVVDVRYYPEEGHGFSKRENQIDALTRTINWFEKYMAPDSRPAG